MPKEHLATLQASNSIGKSFAQNSHKSLIYGNKDGKASAVSDKKDAKRKRWKFLQDLEMLF